MRRFSDPGRAMQAWLKVLARSRSPHLAAWSAVPAVPADHAPIIAFGR